MIDVTQFPQHKAGMILSHNEHKGVYLTVEEAIEQQDFGTDSWVSEEQKQLAIDTDEWWMLQWYPRTPIGFCILSAAQLPVLLSEAHKEDT